MSTPIIDRTVQDRAEIDLVVARFVEWMETGASPAGLLAEDCFGDVSMPQWRFQVEGGVALAASRHESHPYPGRVRVEKVDRTENGFAIAFEERWVNEGQDWYCREQMTAEVRDGQICDIRFYCTGDWDEAVQAEHSRTVTLVRP